MIIGDTVKIEKCVLCPTIVGKTAKVKRFVGDSEDGLVELNFGRGRPQLNRPTTVHKDDISLVVE